MSILSTFSARVRLTSTYSAHLVLSDGSPPALHHTAHLSNGKGDQLPLSALALRVSARSSGLEFTPLSDEHVYAASDPAVFPEGVVLKSRRAVGGSPQPDDEHEEEEEKEEGEEEEEDNEGEDLWVLSSFWSDGGELGEEFEGDVVATFVRSSAVTSEGSEA